MRSLNSTSKTKRTPDSGSFVCEIPLAVNPSAKAQLGSVLEASRQLYNACLGETLRRLRLMRESRAYQAARRLPKKAKERTAAFKKVREQFAFDEYSMHAYAATIKHGWIGDHIGINVAQKVATRAFKAVEKVAFGLAKRVRFKRYGGLNSIEGKNNATGLIWKGAFLKVGKLELPALIDSSDPVVAHGLSCRVKYCRLVQRNINGIQRFYAQLCCEGKTLSAKDRHLLRSRKPPEERRKPLISEGGSVGMDIGPSTIAIVGEKDAALLRFCDEIEPKREEIGKLQKQLDRQRRANNPQNFEENGTIKKGSKTWVRSERQKETQKSLAEMQRRTAAHRKNLHGSLLNSLPLHEDFYLEKLSYRSFQKNFGRSVGMRAPGMFVEELKRKAINAGGSVYEFPTATTKLSQTCHCGKVQKKSLSERWHSCGCGVEAQRDLYSAYLSRFVREGKLNAADAAKHWQGSESLLQTAFERIQVANRGPPPASFGLKNRRQSDSSAVEGIAKSEAANAVAGKQFPSESCRELEVFSFRTPRL